MKNSGMAMRAITITNSVTMFRIPRVTVSICFSFFLYTLILVSNYDIMQVGEAILGHGLVTVGGG
jgi:hypothetical protein